MLSTITTSPNPPISTANKCLNCEGRGYFDCYLAGNDGYFRVRPSRLAMFQQTYPDAVFSFVDICPDCAQQRKAARVWGEAGIPKKRLHCTFEHFDAFAEDMRRGKITARDFAETIGNGDSILMDGMVYHSLVMTGPTGQGKSGLMAAAAQLWIRANRELLWVDHNEFISAVRSSYEDDAEFTSSTIVESAQRTPFLCLDDLGDMNRIAPISDHTREKTYDVIRYRYENELPTIITSNLDFGGMVHQFGARITDRIFEMCHAVALDGKSLRFGL